MTAIHGKIRKGKGIKKASVRLTIKNTFGDHGSQRIEKHGIDVVP